MDTSIMYSKAPPQKHVRRQSKETPGARGLLTQRVSSGKGSPHANVRQYERQARFPTKCRKVMRMSRACSIKEAPRKDSRSCQLTRAQDAKLSS